MRLVFLLPQVLQTHT